MQGDTTHNAFEFISVDMKPEQNFNRNI